MEIIQIEGKVETLQELPKTEDQIDLSMIEGWEKVDERQQYFLYLYFQHFPRKTYTRMQSGITLNKLNSWLKQDHDFKFVYDEIENLHKENLHAIHYMESMHDARVRKDVLKSLGVEGYQPKGKEGNTTNILNTSEKSLAEMAKIIQNQ